VWICCASPKAELAFLLVRKVKVNVIDFRTHLFKLLIGDFDSEFLLCCGKGGPELAPGGEFYSGGPNEGHFFALKTMS